jgi:DNA helicase-2/ATP-dependent DNA helicase PcrA
VETELNERQREAVEHGDGPLLVLAGAGSGKTRVITTRIGRLIANGTSPDAILALTFTNKAAAEMRRRLERSLGPLAADVWISTFHSATAQVLRRHIRRLGYTASFSIYDDQDRARLIKQCMVEENIGEQALAPAVAAWAIDRAKNEALSPEEVLRRPRFGELAARIYRRYQAALERQNAVDFADLLLLAVRLFREHPDVLAGYHARLQQVLVDEYQDTNRAQYLWLRQLAAGDQPNLCVVGDDDQSIYGWRGAELRNILDFERDFPSAHVIRLEQNYRSTKTILAAAGAVVANNRGRKGKTLWTANPAGDPVRLVVAEDDLAEARFAIAEVRRLVESGRSLGEMVIFYRTNAQSRAIEEAAMRAALPYTIVGGIRFYERKEIKDLLAYLRVLANPADDASLERVINCPPRGIGDQTVAAVRAEARRTGQSMVETLRARPSFGVGTAPAARLREFTVLLERLDAAADGPSLAALLESVLAETSYRDRLEAGGSDRTSRLEDIDELIGVARDFDARAAASEPTRARLARFLEEAALLSDWDRAQAGRDRLTLMTLHTSKGLEYPVVFILGLEEGIFPHQRAVDDPDELEEERRLCYVGMTRARERLYLLRAERRLRFGTVSERAPSRFLDEVPESLLHHASPTANEPRLYRATPRSPFQRGGRSTAPRVAMPSFTLKPSEDGAPVIDYSYSQVGDDGDGGLPAGTRVRHPTFGMGIVRRSEGRGETEKLSVQFARAGMKKLMRRFAKLEIVA